MESTPNENVVRDDFKLDEILSGLKSTKKYLDDEVNSLEKTLGRDSIPVNNVKNAISGIENAIPPFEKVVKVYDDLKEAIIKPVNEKIVRSARTGIRFTFMGLAISLIGLITTAISLRSGNEANATVEKLKDIKTSNVSLKDKIETMVGKSSLTFNVIADYKVKLLNIITTTKNQNLTKEIEKTYSEICEKLEKNNVTEADILKLAVMRIYMDLSQAVYAKSKDMIDILSSVDLLLQKNLSEEDKIDLLWLKSEARSQLGAFQKSKDALQLVDYSGMDDYEVLDVLNKRLVSIKQGILEKNDKLTTEVKKNDVRIILLNASQPPKEHLAGTYKRFLVRHGFSEKNITTEDSRNKVSRVYAYYRNNRDVEMLKNILRKMYPGREDDFFDISSFDVSINPWIFRRFENDKDLTFLIRLPRDD